jgi:hypothetical protein
MALDMVFRSGGIIWPLFSIVQDVVVIIRKKFGANVRAFWEIVYVGILQVCHRFRRKARTGWGTEVYRKN